MTPSTRPIHSRQRTSCGSARFGGLTGQPRRSGGETPPDPVDTSRRSRIVAGPCQLFGVPQRCLIGGEPEQPGAGDSGLKSEAHAQGSEPGRISANDLVEREQRNPCAGVGGQGAGP
jgi:hypothetical protein